jgi:transposase
MLHQGALNADRFIAFLRRLIKDAGRKVVLIVDNLKVHKAGKVQAWVKSHAPEIALFYLPPYAPDHNPSEYLNNDLSSSCASSRNRGQSKSWSSEPGPCCAPSSARRSASGPTSGPSPSATPHDVSGIITGD